MAQRRGLFNPQIRLFVFVGIRGGFTTFSAFAYETATLLYNQRIVRARLNVGLPVFLGVAAVASGGCFPASDEIFSFRVFFLDIG